MKILALTAGAGGMYCGSCIRDNALAAELKKQGHAVTLLPLYTPTLTDDPNVSESKVFCGGISVFLQQHSDFFRRSSWRLDRVWDSPWVLKLASQRAIALNPAMLGEQTVSMLQGEAGLQRKEVWKLTAWLREQDPPDLTVIPNSLLIGLARPVRQATGRPVCCTLQGEDLFLSQLPEPSRTEALALIRAQVEHVDGFVAVSEFYAETMCELLGIPENKMQVVPLGINLEGCDCAPRMRNHDFVVGYFARIAPEKGLHVLADAYIRLRRETEFSGALLQAAGYLAPDQRGYLRGIEQKMKAAGLAHEFSYRGVLNRPRKLEYLRSLNLLCVPCTYDEPKGIFLLEAMANGTPVVAPRRGSFPEILGKTGGGILVKGNDAASVAEGILEIWRDPSLESELAERGARKVREHFSANHMAKRAVEVYDAVAAALEHA